MRQMTKRSVFFLVISSALLMGAAGCRQPLPPDYYGFRDLQVGQGGGQTLLSTTLKFYNPNPFSIQLKRAELDLSINGKHAGHSLLDSTIFIPQKDTFFVPVSMSLDLKAIFSNALAVLLNQEATISLDGRVRIKRGAVTFSRPFHYDGKQDLKSLLPSGSGF